MNKTDRLLSIILELQGKGKQRAEDLAATFETSKRTIYRDIQALSEAGVPLVAIPGQGYSLPEGYFLPPLSFNTDEAMLLLLGSDFMGHNFDAQYQKAAQSAGRKIEGVLPQKIRDEVHYLQTSIRFIVLGQENPSTSTLLQQIRRSIIERRTVQFDYHTRHRSDNGHAPNSRAADPYGLAHVGGNWHLVAYCHLRHDVRNFRLDRIENLNLSSKIFERPANFKMQRPADVGRDKTVLALFDREVMRWVQESPNYYIVSEEERADGLLVTFQVRQDSDVLQWLLGWGKHVRVLEPVSLQQQLVEEAKSILEIYN